MNEACEDDAPARSACLRVLLSLPKNKPPLSGRFIFWQGQKDLNPRHAVLEFFRKRIIVHYAVLRSVIFVYNVLHIIPFRKNKALLNDIFKKSIRQVLDRVLDKIQPSCTRFTEHKFRGLKTKESDNHSIKSQADH